MLLKRVLQNVPGNSQENICGRVFFNNVACYKPAKTDFFTSVFSVRICQDFSEQLFNTTFQLLFLSCFWNKEQPAFTFTSHPISIYTLEKNIAPMIKKFIAFLFTLTSTEIISFLI